MSEFLLFRYNSLRPIIRSNKTQLVVFTLFVADILCVEYARRCCVKAPSAVPRMSLEEEAHDPRQESPAREIKTADRENSASTSPIAVTAYEGILLPATSEPALH